jgi:hypothetical protein
VIFQDYTTISIAIVKPEYSINFQAKFLQVFIIKKQRTVDYSACSIHMLSNGTAISTSRNWIASIVKVCPLNYRSCWLRLVNITALKLRRTYGDFLTTAAYLPQMKSPSQLGCACMNSDLRLFGIFYCFYKVIVCVLVDLIKIRCYLTDNINNLARLLGLIFNYRLLFMDQCIHDYRL